jgi:hypothetical protein
LSVFPGLQSAAYLNSKMASIYKEEEKLEASAQGGGGMRMWSSMAAR